MNLVTHQSTKVLQLRKTYKRSYFHLILNQSNTKILSSNDWSRRQSLSSHSFINNCQCIHQNNDNCRLTHLPLGLVNNQTNDVSLCMNSREQYTISVTFYFHNLWQDIVGHTWFCFSHILVVFLMLTLKNVTYWSQYTEIWPSVSFECLLIK